MRHEVIKYEAGPKRGYVIRRLDTKQFFFKAFAARDAAEWRTATLDNHPRFWVDSIDLVIFSLADSLRQRA